MAALPRPVQAWFPRATAPYGELSRDGRKVLLLTADKEARVMSAATGRPASPPLAHANNIVLARLSPDGTRVVTVTRRPEGRSCAVHVWDAASGRAVAPPTPQALEVTDILFRDQGRFFTLHKPAEGRAADLFLPFLEGGPQPRDIERLLRAEARVGGVFGAASNPLALAGLLALQAKALEVGRPKVWLQGWSSARGRPLGPPRTLEVSGRLVHAAFVPGGRAVTVAANVDGLPEGSPVEACFWDVESGKRLGAPLRGLFTRGLFGGLDMPRPSTLSAGGERVAILVSRTAHVLTPAGVSVAVEHAPVRRRRLDTTPLFELAKIFGAEGIVALSPDGKHLLTASKRDGTVSLWDADTGSPLFPGCVELDGHLLGAAFSPDGRSILAVSTAAVQVWDAGTGRPRTPPLMHDRRFMAAKFSPDGRRLLLVGSREAKLWELPPARSAPVPLPAGTGALDIAIGADGPRLLLAQGRTVLLWDAAAGKAVARLGHAAEVSDARFSPDGARLLTVSGGKTVRVWDARTGGPLTPALEHGRPVFEASFTPDGRRVIVTNGGFRALALWDVATRSKLALAREKGTGSVVFGRDGARELVFHVGGKTARCWDLAAGRPLTKPFPTGLMDRVAFSGDARRMAWWSSDSNRLMISNRLLILDAATGRVLNQPGLKHDADIRHADFSPDGERLLTVTDHEVWLWDVTAGKLLMPPLRHEERVTRAAFGPQAECVITDNCDLVIARKWARLWEARSGQPLTPALTFGPEREEQGGWRRRTRVAFSPDLLRAGGVSRGQAWLRDFRSARTPQEWARRAQVLAGRRITAHGTVVPLSTEEVRALWQD
jgi:WD40 repeat protein